MRLNIYRLINLVSNYFKFYLYHPNNIYYMINPWSVFIGNHVYKHDRMIANLKYITYFIKTDNKKTAV